MFLQPNVYTVINILALRDYAYSAQCRTAFSFSTSSTFQTLFFLVYTQVNTMQFFTRIITQMLHGPLGEKLANAKWMQNLAQNTHKGMETLRHNS